MIWGDDAMIIMIIAPHPPIGVWGDDDDDHDRLGTMFAVAVWTGERGDDRQGRLMGRRRFMLVFESVPPRLRENMMPPPEPARRLAGLLKAALRQFGFRCLRVEELTAGGQPATPQGEEE